MTVACHQQRRQFMVGIVATLTWPLIVRAQQSSKLPRIGFIGSSTAAAMSSWIAAFTKRLAELGWIENHTLTIDYQFAEGRNARYAEIANDFVRQRVDIIVTYGTPPTKAVKAATTTIPVVFAAAADPVAAGLVQSLSRPGGNVTGLSLQQSDIAGKKIELLRETVGNFSKLVIAGNVSNPVSILEINEVTALAKKLGMDVVVLEFRRADDIEPAFEKLNGQGAALYVATDPLVLSNISRINALATSGRLPTIYNSREYLETGGLVSYGPNYPDLFRQAAELVSKILRGTKPADLPVGQPTKFDFVINNRTAKALGLVLSPSMLARADEVIE